MVNKMSYTTPNNKEVPLKVGVEIIHRETEGGVLQSNDNDRIVCQGSTEKIGNNMVDNVLDLVQFKIKIEKDRYTQLADKTIWQLDQIIF